MHRYHKVLALLLLSLICLSLLATLSTASPIVQSSSAFFPISQSPSLQNRWSPRSPGRIDRALSGVRADLLKKRAPPGFTSPLRMIPMKMLSFTKVGLLTPVAVAAKHLEDFYTSIYYKTAGEWQARPESDSLVIQEGSLQLSFYSLGDTIPWSFVTTMVNRLHETAVRGATDLFDVMYADESGNIMVSVSLKIVDHLSSSSGSDQDYREGSVPSINS